MDQLTGVAAAVAVSCKPGASFDNQFPTARRLPGTRDHPVSAHGHRKLYYIVL